jgi:O-antigen/teichoic acid export membrane protein
MHLVAASPVSGATLPALAEVQHDEARFQRLILQTSRILLAITCPIFLGAAAISRDLIPLLFGARWAPASDIFSLLSVAGLLSLMVNFFGTVLLIKKYENWVLYFSGAYTVLIFIVFFALRSLHQASLAMPFLLPYLVIFPASLMKFLMVSGLSPVKWLQSVAAPVVSAALMTVVVLLTGRLLANLDAAPRLIISILGGGAIYVGLMSLAARDLVDGIAEIVRRRLS